MVSIFPSILNNDFFDDFDNLINLPKSGKLSELSQMKTDITEKDGSYLLDIELPGYSKENITIRLENGFLKVTASRNEKIEDKDEKGTVVKIERFTGTCERKFFVGKEVSMDDVKASFENGELKITFPKVDKSVEKTTIKID